MSTKDETKYVNVEVMKGIANGTYKYIELCNMNLFKNGYKTGGSVKKAQIDELKLYRDVKPLKGKIILGDIFDTKKVEISSGLLRGDIQLLVLDLLSKNEDYHIDLPITKLMFELDLVNQSYINGYDYEKKYNNSNILDKYRKFVVDDTYNNIYSKGKRAVIEALDDLQDQSIINWQMACKVAKYDYMRMDNGMLCFDQDGKPIKNGELIYDYATPLERKHIINAEKKIMGEMNVKNKHFFNINHDARNKFRTRVKKLLDQYDIHHYYYVYDIVYLHDEVLESLKSREASRTQKQLNTKFLDQLYKTIDNMVESATTEDVKVMIENGVYTEEELIKKFGYNVMKALPSFEVEAKSCTKRLVDRGQRKRDEIKVVDVKPIEIDEDLAEELDSL